VPSLNGSRDSQRLNDTFTAFSNTTACPGSTPGCCISLNHRRVKVDFIDMDAHRWLSVWRHILGGYNCDDPLRDDGEKEIDRLWGEALR